MYNLYSALLFENELSIIKIIINKCYKNSVQTLNYKSCLGFLTFVVMIKEKITSLEELLEVLPQCTGSDYVGLIKRIELEAKDFSSYQFWSPDHYTRNCIVKTESHELILLCWEEDQGTPIHCHAGEECWVYLLQGGMKEIRYEDQKGTNVPLPINETVVKERQFSYMSDEMGYHSLKNTHSGRSMSLHLYMNPIDTCQAYNEKTEEFDWKILSYHSKDGILL